MFNEDFAVYSTSGNRFLKEVPLYNTFCTYMTFLRTQVGCTVLSFSYTTHAILNIHLSYNGIGSHRLKA